MEPHGGPSPRVQAQTLGLFRPGGTGPTTGTHTFDARGHFCGMTTHSGGGFFLEPQARAIIDMGALHTRAVAMDERSKDLRRASPRPKSWCHAASRCRIYEWHSFVWRAAPPSS